jgi:hypothetical protein
MAFFTPSSCVAINRTGTIYLFVQQISTLVEHETGLAPIYNLVVLHQKSVCSRVNPPRYNRDSVIQQGKKHFGASIRKGRAHFRVHRIPLLPVPHVVIKNGASYFGALILHKLEKLARRQ